MPNIDPTERRLLTDRELQEMDRDGPTDVIVKNAARAAGLSVESATSGGEIAFTGHDETFDEVMAERTRARPFALASEAGNAAVEVLGYFVRLPLVAELGAPLVSSVMLVEDHVEEIARSSRAKDAILRDALYVALLVNLRGLPEGFVARELQKRWEVHGSARAPTMRIAEQLKLNPGLAPCLPLLQRRCDEGMHAAERIVLAGDGGVREAFAKHRELAELYQARYENDAAFRIGFEAFLWAHERAHDPERKDPAPLDTLLDALRARNAWLLQQRIVRG